MNHRSRLSFAVPSGAALGLLCLFYFFQHSASSLAASQPNAAALAPANPQWDWNLDCVDCPRQFDKSGPHSLAMDDAGVLHVVYGEDHLYHAWQDGNGWQVEVVDPSDWVGTYSSLAIDSQGYLYAGYIDSQHSTLKYAYQDASGWHTQTLTQAIPSALTLALNTSDEAQIAFTSEDTDGSPKLMYASQTSGGWAMQAISSPPLTGSLYAMALDASDRPHLIYQDGDNGALNYASWDGSAWFTETIAPAVGWAALTLDTFGEPMLAYTAGAAEPLLFTYRDKGGWHAPQVVWEDPLGDTPLTTLSLATDSLHHPLIAFGVSGAPAELKLARLVASEWQLESVCADESVEYSAMIVDTTLITEQVHISYLTHGFSNWRQFALKHVYQDESGWQQEEVDTVGVAGTGASLALDPQGYAHFSYWNYWPAEILQYAYQDATGFHIEAVSSSHFGWSDLALDSHNFPHIAYQNGNSPQIRYAYKTPAGWQIETLSDGWGPSLAMDVQDYPHIAYTNQLGVQYAYQDAQGWHFETLDNHNALLPSLVLDERGKAHLSYRRKNPDDLMYAVQSDSGWTLELVENTGEIGDYSSLALDPDGHPHICYYSYHSDTDRGDLKYAYWNGSGWEITTVDASQNSGNEVSLALNARGLPLMSYRSGPTADRSELRFAYLNGSRWYTQTLDAAGALNGLSSSLAVDGQGRLHIGYHNMTLGDLRYASFTPTAPHNLTINGPATSALGATTTFTATVQPISTTLPLEYTWQATDGQVVENSRGLHDQATFVWTTQGEKTVQVRAENLVGTTTGTFTITVTDVPIQGLAASNDSPTLIGQPTRFQASVQGGANVSYTWDFGDGATASGATVTHVYPAAQTYLTTVTASNSAGSQTATTEVLIEPRRLFLPGILNR
jgi:hypothetical protein